MHEVVVTSHSLVDASEHSSMSRQASPTSRYPLAHSHLKAPPSNGFSMSFIGSLTFRFRDNSSRHSSIVMNLQSRCLLSFTILVSSKVDKVGSVTRMRFSWVLCGVVRTKTTRVFFFSFQFVARLINNSTMF